MHVVSGVCVTLTTPFPYATEDATFYDTLDCIVESGRASEVTNPTDTLRLSVSSYLSLSLSPLPEYILHLDSECFSFLNEHLISNFGAFPLQEYHVLF